MTLLKNTLYVGAVALIAVGFVPEAFAGCGKEHGAKTEAHDHSEMTSMAPMGVGVVNSIMLEDRKVNMTHGAIPELKWPAMTMDLAVAEDVDLTEFSAEDAVKFHIELGEDKVYRITKMMKKEECDHDMAAGEVCDHKKEPATSE